MGCSPWGHKESDTTEHSTHTREDTLYHDCSVQSLSRVRLFAIPWTAAYQAPPSMGFSRQEYWSGVPLPFKSAQRSIDSSQPGAEADSSWRDALATLLKIETKVEQNR